MFFDSQSLDMQFRFRKQLGCAHQLVSSPLPLVDLSEVGWGAQANFKDAPWAKAWKDHLEGLHKKLGQSTTYMTAMLTG